MACAGAACGGNDEDGSPATTVAVASTEAPASSAEDSTAAAPVTDSAVSFPVQIEHQLGTITIDEEPQRVVAMSTRDADTLLALGVTPVGIHSRYDFESGVGPWAENLLGDAQPVVWLGPEFNYEAVASVDPDLIVYTASGGEADVYETLSAIAPVIDLPIGAVPYGATPAESTMLIGRALGRGADAERVVAGLDDYLAEQAAAHPSFAGRTANYLDIYTGGVTSYSQEHIVNRILYSVGFEPIPGSELPAGEGFVGVSAENLSEYDADIVLAFPFGRTLDELVAETPTIATLNSYVNGGFFVLDDLALSNSSVLSIPYAMDRLLPKFDAALTAG